jgi:signal peptidase I
MTGETETAVTAEFPTSEQLENELKAERYKHSYLHVLRSTVYTLVVVAAVAILAATLWLPVLQIIGTSMSPTLEEGNIVVSVKGSKFDAGDVIAFYYNNNVLVKRVVARSGDWIDIDESGNVYVNGELLDEPYLDEEQKAFGETNIELPYQVPDNRIFVIGDNRDVSIDSRNTSVGCIAEEQIVGQIVFKIWPVSEFGSV